MPLCYPLVNATKRVAYSGQRSLLSDTISAGAPNKACAAMEVIEPRCLGRANQNLFLTDSPGGDPLGPIVAATRARELSRRLMVVRHAFQRDIPAGPALFQNRVAGVR